MNPDRRATPTSVAAHSLYEQADPFTVREPDGTLDLTHARYEAVDDRRARVSGATWRDTTPDDQAGRCAQDRRTGGAAVRVRRSAVHRAVQGAAAESGRPGAEPGMRGPAAWTIRCGSGSMASTACGWWCRKTNRRRARCSSWASASRRRGERASEVVRTCKQFMLHFGYPGRLSTAGNLAFPFTPPEVSLGPAYRFNVYHLLHVDDADALFPVEIETVG